MVELHREGSAPAACAAGLFVSRSLTSPFTICHYLLSVKIYLEKKHTPVVTNQTQFKVQVGKEMGAIYQPIHSSDWDSRPLYPG